MIARIAIAGVALLELALARLLPESGVGLFVRLGAATIVVLLPGGLVAEALGFRSAAATLAWTLASLTFALGVVFLLHASLSVALWILLALALGALALAPRRPRTKRMTASGLVLGAGIVLGALAWRVAPAAVQGDGLFHLARVRKLADLGSLHVSSLNELVHGGLHPGYAFPLWHGFLAAVANLAGVDPTLVVQHESSLLVPLALLVTYEAGTTLFRSSSLGIATVAAQVSIIAFAPGHGGSYSVLDLPATASRQLLVPAVLTLVFMHVASRSWKTLASIAAAALALALVHPTYALFVCVPLGGWLVVRALVDPRDALPIAEALAAVVVPSVGVALALLPIVRQTVSHNPSRTQLDESLAHYGNQIDLLSGGRYRLAPEVFGRSGAVTIAALVLVPLAALAWRRRWASFVLGGSLAVLALMLMPFLFEHLSDAVSLSQSRRAAGFLPFAIAFAGGLAVLARLLGAFVLPLGLAAGIALQLAWPGDFGYALKGGGPALVTWIAAFGGATALVGALIMRRPGEVYRPGALAVLGACLCDQNSPCHFYRGSSDREGGGAPQLVNRAFGDDLSLADHADTGAHQLDLAEQMTGDQNGSVAFAELDDEVSNIGHALGVEAVGGFVEDQELRLLEQGSGDSKPLLHSKRVGGELVVRTRRELHLGEGVVHARWLDPAVDGKEAQVVVARHVRVEGRRFDDRANFGQRRRRSWRGARDRGRPERGPDESQEHA